MGTKYYTRCAACEKKIKTAEDGHECGRVKCFNYTCEDCNTGYRYELDVCGEECAEESARELTAKVRALHAAPPAVPAADRVIEYVDNSWLRTPSVGQQLARMQRGKRVA